MGVNEIKLINDHYKNYYEKKDEIGNGGYGTVYKIINKKQKKLEQ